LLVGHKNFCPPKPGVYSSYATGNMKSLYVTSFLPPIYFVSGDATVNNRGGTTWGLFPVPHFSQRPFL